MSSPTYISLSSADELYHSDIEDLQIMNPTVMASEALIWVTPEQVDVLDKNLTSLENTIIYLKDKCIEGTDEWFRKELELLDEQDSLCTKIRSEVHSLGFSCNIFTKEAFAQIVNPECCDFSEHSHQQQSLVRSISASLAFVTTEVNASTLRVQDPEKHRLQLEHNALVEQHSHLLKERDRLNDLGWEIERERNILQAKNEHLQASNDDLRSNQKEFCQELLAHRVATAKLRDDCYQLQVEKETLSDKSLLLEQEISNNYDNIRRKLTSDYNDAKKAWEEKCSKSEQRLENLKVVCETLEIENRRQASEVQSKDNDLETMNRTNQNLTFQNNNQQIEIGHQAQQVQQLMSENQALKYEINIVQGVKQDQETKITELETENRELRRQFRDRNTEVERLKKGVSHMKSDFATVMNAASRWADPSPTSTPSTGIERRRSAAAGPNPGSASNRVQNADEDDNDRPTTAVGSRVDPNENRPGYHQVRGHWAKNPQRQT